ncbi:MAG: glutamyl-tRNA reductase [Solirubrobacterales bacterium]|jgi:glutamyl-tRNA reductase|nr:glutamyl-tRNA reductase [Solirubrobacterales bacterium]
MAELLALGVSHKTAPLELRERMALTEGRAVGVLGELAERDEILEAAAISTCNRTELYLYAADKVGAEAIALGLLSREAKTQPTDLVGHLYSLQGAAAAEQLFRVTSGLDSMIIGEAEIQGQVKRAYELALVEGATGPVLNRLFRAALAAGKRARSETAISERSMSIPSVAVELAQRTLGELDDRRVLVVGAGETAELTARALAAKGVQAIFIANRHYDRAIGLAQRFGGHAVRFEELPEELADADIVVTSTSSPHHVIEREGLTEVMKARNGRPLLLIDLAVPRDIHPASREVPGTSLYDMDDLQALVERNVSGREAEARHVEGILRSELARFDRWFTAQDVTPTIVALRERADEIVARVLEENEQRWEGMTEADRERLQVAARAIASRLLHEPTLRLKRDADEDNVYAKVAVLRELFGLDPGSEPMEGADAEVTELRQHRDPKRGRGR